MRAISFSGTFGDSADFLLSTPRFGVTVLMSAAWGIGLLLNLTNLTGVVLVRVWEA